MKRSVYAHRDTIKELAKPTPPPPRHGGLKPVREAYCYRVLQDVMCYHQPVAGAEARLVAYQGNAQEEFGGEGVANSKPQDTQMAAAVQPVAVTETGPKESSIHVPLLVEPQAKPAGPPPAEEAKADSRAVQSMKKFDSSPAVFVGEGPKVKPDMTPIPEEPVR